MELSNILIQLSRVMAIVCKYSTACIFYAKGTNYRKLDHASMWRNTCLNAKLRMEIFADTWTSLNLFIHR